MSNGLVPFEKKVESWEVIHPRRWIATADRNQAANFISTQARKITEAQLKAADRIVVSQDRIADKIDDAIVASRDMAGGIEELQATFEWGFTELIWQIEQEREVLKNILKVLQAPLDTEAKELRKRAEYAYKNGWIDDAFEDFLKSEKKNRYDFTIHQNLGNIYFFEKKDPGNALEYYEKAVKYAIPKSSYYTSISLLHIGLVKYLQEDFRGAYEATLKAIELSPNLYEAHYQHAQYCVKLGKYDEAIKHLKKAIVEGDRYYCVKADSEEDFDSMKTQLHSLFKELENKAQSEAELQIQETQKLTHDACLYGFSMPSTVREQLEKANNLLSRKSVFDSWDAVYKAYVAKEMTVDHLLEYFFNMNEKTSWSEYFAEESKIDTEKNILKWSTGFSYLIIAIVFTLLSNLSVGARVGLITLFIATFYPIGYAVAFIVTKPEYSRISERFWHKKDKLEREFLRIKDINDQLHKEKNRIIPRGLRSKAHRAKRIKEMTYDEWKKWKEKEGENSKQLSEDLKHLEEFEEEEFGSSYEKKEANYERLANKIRKNYKEIRKKCSHCGKTMKIDHKYCSRCGAKVK